MTEDQENELDELGPVPSLLMQDAKRWGVAVPDPERPGSFRVERYADYDITGEVADGRPYVKVAWQHPTTGRFGVDWTYAMVSSSDCCRTWYFAATGWLVPR